MNRYSFLRAALALGTCFLSVERLRRRPLHRQLAIRSRAQLFRLCRLRLWAPPAALQAAAVETYFFAANGLLMTRDSDDHQILSYRAVDGEPMLCDRDADMGWGGGFEARFGRYFNCGYNAIEAIYWGIYPGGQIGQHRRPLSGIGPQHPLHVRLFGDGPRRRQHARGQRLQRRRIPLPRANLSSPQRGSQLARPGRVRMRLRRGRLCWGRLC